MPVATLEKPREETEELPEESPEETASEEVAEREGGEDEEVRKIVTFLGPEGVIMMTFAVALDVLGIIFFILDFVYGIGEIPSYISDGLGIAFFGTWVFFRSQFQTHGYSEAAERVKATRDRRKAMPREEKKKIIQLMKSKAKEGTKALRAGRRVFLRFLITTIGELVPVLGNILPMWTWFVWSELKSS